MGCSVGCLQGSPTGSDGGNMNLGMNRGARSLLAVAAAAALGVSAMAQEKKPPKTGGGTAGAATFQVPVEYYKLPNGLRVVLSQDHTAPTVCVAVYYQIGFRIEPKDRTGFAHLFEHMMFQGSQNLGKMEFVKLVQQNGGTLNGSTRFDLTNYFEILPSNKLETALWAEADRMNGLAVTEENLKNQQGVVGNEVKVNVLNRPYGAFPWLQMPQHANTNWYNAHNFYGDLHDFEAAQAKQFVEKYFGKIAASKLPPPPDLTEPKQEKEKRVTETDALAKRPAIAIAYHMPERGTPEYYAMGLIDQILVQGDDSMLYQDLVQKRGLTDSVEGGINYLGNMFNYKGPMLWMADWRYDPSTKPEAIVQAVDGVVEPLRTKPVDKATLDRAMVKLRSSLYDSIGQFSGFGLADLLASFALFDDNPARVNELVGQFEKVTPELIQKTAQEYLRPENRTVLVCEPKAADAPAAPAKNQ